MVQFLKYLWVFQNPNWIIKNVTKAAWPVDMFHEKIKKMASRPEALVRFHRRKWGFTITITKQLVQGWRNLGRLGPLAGATSHGPPHHFILQPLRHCLRGWRVFDGKSCHDICCMSRLISKWDMHVKGVVFVEFNDVVFSGKIYNPLKDKSLKCSLWISVLAIVSWKWTFSISVEVNCFSCDANCFGIWEYITNCRDSNKSWVQIVQSILYCPNTCIYTVYTYVQQYTIVCMYVKMTYIYIYTHSCSTYGFERFLGPWFLKNATHIPSWKELWFEPMIHDHMTVRFHRFTICWFGNGANKKKHPNIFPI